MKTPNPEPREHTLEYLLAFDGRIHRYDGGYWLKFEIKQSEPEPSRPHGLRYSFTLHGPANERLIGFDNAHPLSHRSRRSNARETHSDHWHRTAHDKGRPYGFTSAEALLNDFFREVERVLRERGIALESAKDAE
jgi:hypothetical protein